MSPRAYTRARTAFRQTAMHLHRGMDAEAALAATRGRFLAWDPAGGAQGLGDWTALLEAAAAAETTRGVSSGRYVGSARRAMDLAATWELIPRTELHGGTSAVIPAAWAEVQGRWVEAARHPGVAAVLGVNRLLHAIHDVLGPDTDPETLTLEEAQRVVDHLSEAITADGGLNASRRSSIRRSIRNVRDAGHLPRELTVNAWDYRQRNRRTAWGDPEVSKIAREFAQRTRPQEPDYAVWEQLPYPGLVRCERKMAGDRTRAVPAPYTLPAVVDFYTTPEPERQTLNLPPLGAGAWPLDRRPRGESDRPEWWASPRTVAHRLKAWGLYVGWIERARPEVDLSSADLRDLVTASMLEAFAGSSYTTDKQIANVMITIGLGASPVLESHAIDAGDEALADQFYRAACCASGKGKLNDDGRVTRENLADVHLKRHEQARRDRTADEHGTEFRNEAERVEWVFERAMGHLGHERAYACYAAIYRAARRRCLQEHWGIESLRELEDGWEDLVTQPVRQLTALRRIATLNFTLGAPVRTSTQPLLEERMLHRTPTALRLDTPGSIHKRPENGPYRVTLWRQDATEADDLGFDLDMMTLYVDRIRPALLAGHRCSRLWVTNMNTAAARSPEVLPATVRQDVRDALRYGCAELGLSRDAVDLVLSVKPVHSIRHAIGTWCVQELGDVETAKALLHHSPASTEALETYTARGDDASMHAARATIGATPDTSGRDLEQIRREIRDEVEAEVRTEMWQELKEMLG